ncbi:hypothetical protein CDIK_0531 [Cucumispora dikerogammari]|nr:hypothetical protein CDIK_0531 [Cucumispora dikerogammari]
MIQEPIPILTPIHELYTKKGFFFKDPPLGTYINCFYDTSHCNFLIKLPKLEVILFSIRDEVLSPDISVFDCLVRSIFGAKTYKINKDHLIPKGRRNQDCLRVLWGTFIQDLLNDFQPEPEEEILKFIKSESIFTKLKGLLSEPDENSNENKSVSISSTNKTTMSISEMLDNFTEVIRKSPEKYTFDEIVRFIIMLPDSDKKYFKMIEETLLFPIQSVNVLVSDLNENYNFFGSQIKNEFFPPDISKINVKNKEFSCTKLQDRFYDLFYSEQNYVMQLLEFQCFYAKLFKKEDLDETLLSIKKAVYLKTQDILLLHIDLLFTLTNLILVEVDIKDLDLRSIYQLMKTDKLFSNIKIKDKIKTIINKSEWKQIGKRLSKIFEKFLPKFSIYQNFITGSHEALEAIKTKNFLCAVSTLISRKEETIKSDFNQIILLPFHRLSRYKLYFEDIESLIHTNSLIDIIVKISTFDNLIHKKREESIRLIQNIKLNSLISNMPSQYKASSDLFLLQINLESFVNNSPLSLFLNSNYIIVTKRIGPKSDIFDFENDTSYEFIKKVSINNIKSKFKEQTPFLILKSSTYDREIPGAMCTVLGENVTETISLSCSNPLLIEQFMRTVELYKNKGTALKSKHYVNTFNSKNVNHRVFYHVYNAKQYIKNQMSSKNVILISSKEYSNKNGCQGKFIISSKKSTCIFSSLIIKIFKSKDYTVNIESSKNIKFNDFVILEKDFEALFNKIITKIFHIHHIASPIEEGDALVFIKQCGAVYDKVKYSAHYRCIEPLDYYSGLCYMNSIRRLMNYCIKNLKENKKNDDCDFVVEVSHTDYNSILQKKTNHEKFFKKFDINVLLTTIAIYFRKHLYQVLTFDDIQLISLYIRSGAEAVKQKSPIVNDIIPKKYAAHFFYLKNEYFFVFLRFFSNYYEVTNNINFICVFEFMFRGQGFSEIQIKEFLQKIL